MATIANLLIKISADIKGALPSLDKLPEKLEAIGKTADSAGKALTRGLTLPLAAVGIAALKMSTDMNAAMANVATLIPGSTDRVLELKSAVQDMAIATGKGTTDLAGGLYQVISAFGDGADTAKILEINAKGAAAGLATTTDAINLTSAVTKGYGDTSAKAVQHASDLAFQTVKLGQTTFPELAASIGRVVPLAAALSVKQEELFGVMATATGVTGGAAEVSTQLRGVLQSILAPTENATKLMKAMGFANGEAMIKQLGLQGAITALTNAAKQSGKPLQDFVASIEGQTLALALSGGQAATLTQKMAAMKGVTGETDKAFAEQTQGINKAGFAWAQLSQRVAVTAQRLGDELAPIALDTAKSLQPLFDSIMGAVRAFGQMDPASKRMAIGFTVAVAAVGPLLIAIGQMASGLAVLIPMFSTGGAGLKVLSFGASSAAVAFKAMMGPIGVIGIGLGIIAAKAIETNRAWDEANKRQMDSLVASGQAVSKATAIWGRYSKGMQISGDDAKIGAVGLRLLASEAINPAMAKALREKAALLQKVADNAAKVATARVSRGPDAPAPKTGGGATEIKGLANIATPIQAIAMTAFDAGAVVHNLGAQLSAAGLKAKTFGTLMTLPADQARILKQAMVELIDGGVKPGASEFRVLQSIAKSMNVSMFETGAAVEQAAPKMIDLKESATAVFQSITALKEGVSTIAEAFGVELSGPMMAAISSMGNVGAAVLQVATAVPVLVEQMQGLWLVMEANPVLAVISGLAALAAAASLAWKAFQDTTVADTMRDLTASLGDIQAKSFIVGKSFDATSEKVGAYEQALIKLTKEGKANTPVFAEMSKEYDRLKGNLIAMKVLTEKAAKALEDLRASNQASIDWALDSSLIALYNRNLEQTKKNIMDITDRDSLSGKLQLSTAIAQLIKANDLLKIGGTIASGMGSAFSSAIKNFLSGTGNLTRDLKAGVKDAILNGIVEATMQGAIVKGAFGGLLEQLTSGLASGSDVSGIIGQIGAAIPALSKQLEGALAPLRGSMKGFGKAPAMASGGIVTGPTMALVGEGASNEAVLPLNSDTFGQLGQAIAQYLPAQAQGGQGGTTIQITINAGASVVDDASLERFARMILIKGNQMRGWAT